MSGRDNFLSRWSRRKRAAAPTAEAPATAAAKSPPDGSAAPESGEEPGALDPAVPAFDPASLPPIESITAATDIRAFFAAGVPAELTRAALRRVWTADPKIRDFVGLADYAWDFNAPGSMPGFGPIETADALRRAVARSVSPTATDNSASAGSHRNAEVTRSGATSDASGQDRSLDTIPSKDEPSPNFDELQSRVGDEHAAVERQQDRSEDIQRIARRKHGGALPQS